MAKVLIHGQKRNTKMKKILIVICLMILLSGCAVTKPKVDQQQILQILCDNPRMRAIIEYELNVLRKQKPKIASGDKWSIYLHSNY